MNKIKKIFTLILFILTILGITAPSVVNAYCVQPNVMNFSNANYQEVSSRIVPGDYTEVDETKKDEYMRDYIMTTEGNYTEKERQQALALMEGDEVGFYPEEVDAERVNKLYLEAQAYADNLLAREYQLITLTIGNNAKTTFSENNLIYGPIYVTYPMGNIEDRRDWGGFYYAFFDKEGNNISDKLQLCTLEDGEYKQVTIDGDKDGYNKVTSESYSGSPLYIVTADKFITKVYMKAYSFQIVRRARIVRYEGTAYVSTSMTWTCGATKKVTRSGVGTSVPEGARVTSQTYFPTKYGNHSNTKIGPHTYKCSYCGITGPSALAGECTSNIQTHAHWLYYYEYDDPIPCNGCGKVCYSDKGHSYKCGDTCEVGSYTSQAQEEVEEIGIEEELINEVELEIELGATIEVTKEWEDYDNINNLRPEEIEFNVYRSIDKQNWELLTVNVDYFITIENKDGNTWKVLIAGLMRLDNNGNDYFFKVEEKAPEYYTPIYPEGNYPSFGDNPAYGYIKLENQVVARIDVTKKWLDYDNLYELRPEEIEFNVYRSIDEQNWEELTVNEDYTVTIENKEGSTWKIIINNLIMKDENGNNYYFKVEEKEPTYYDPVYPDGNNPSFDNNPAYGNINIENALKHINISGYVWLDGQTGIKPAVTNNGIMDDSEEKLANILVYLYYKNPETGKISKIAETVTDENGYYEFLDYEIGYYYVEFGYDGINYEDTIKVENADTEKISKAFENDNERSTFNNRFTTITYKQSNDGTTLNYKYANKKSTLVTTNQDGTVTSNFEMNAKTENELRKTDTENLNLGLVKRGLDVALSTDVYDAKVTINGQSTDYTYNKDDNNIEIGTTQTSETVSYNLNLYASDYNYRIRNYVNTQNFQEKDYINDGASGAQTGEELRVYVTYKLNLQNQSTKTTRINEVKYTYDEKYTFVGLENSSYSVQDSGNVVTINLNGLSLSDGETQTLYLVFEVKDNNGLSTGEFTNKAEITSYSNDEGLIDVDSQPGNFVNNNEVEDDSDTAGGLTVTVPGNYERKITGKVFDEDGNSVNDVIVQLIELKTVNSKIYEYIWQETVSGTNSGLRLNADGSALETYSYTASEGYYEFKGFIPGDYIVRFIYGDGTTYDMTDNVIKYNGQDYKSMTDAYYNAEWYNTSSYSAGASVARDNEARRLETMAYSVEINTVKGILLKLLDNVTPDALNETEKETIIAIYNYYYDPDTTEVTQEVINTLLKEQTLKNTWMCAETSKIKIAVDTVDATNTSVTTTVNGINTTYKNNIDNINFGLEQRPVTKIELKKYITGFKLTAANGQTLVNAYIDVNEYLNGTTDISNKVQGIKDNVTILDNVWQYEVVPTEINTVVDGASLEFEYTLVVRNTGADDYLSAELANIYNNNDIETYKTALTTRASDLKTAIRNGTYRTKIGNSVGASYYVGGTGTGKVLTEVTSIRDYVNNELDFVTSGKVAIDESASHTHRILRDDYSMQDATINTILKITETTGKMSNTDNAVMYIVTLGKAPLSSTGNLDFDTYIAEVMSYTNAAGRRATTATPGNAEIVDAEKRDGKTHEIDEADTGRIQIGVATGEDEATNYIIIIAVAAGIALIAVGAYVIKKYFMK